MMMTILGLTTEGRNGKYLGLPVYVGKSRARTFAYLKDRIWQKIQGWKERMLSKVGKEILVKACAQAIPIFAMSCFDLTKGLCEHINSMISRFWWAQQDKENKIHWLGWDKLTLSKKEGGLGYKDLYAFNLAMLAKQGWRLLTNQNSLCARVMKAKYYPNCSVLEAEAKDGISYAWRSILKGVDLLRKGVIKRVGDGITVNIWSDPWLPRLWTRRPVTPRGQTVLTKVCELIDPTTGSWDCDLVQQTFWPQDASLILSLPIFEDLEDEWACHFEEKGSFSVKSAYRLQCQLEAIASHGQQGSLSSHGSFDWNAIWKLECPPKFKQFVWRIAHNSLPYRLNLVRRGMKIDPICPMCNLVNEDGGHLFLKCKQVKACWGELQMESVRVQLLQCTGAKDFVTGILKLDKKQKLLAISLLWWWWQSRNKKVSNEKRKLQGSVTCLARRSAAEFEHLFVKENKPMAKQVQSWTPPEGDELKINVDGSFKMEQCTGGWGFIIRNSNGEPVGAGAGSIKQAYDALQIEAIACLTGLSWARSWGMSQVRIETDSQKLFQAIVGSDQDLDVNG